MSDTIKGILFALAAAGIYGLTPPFTRLAFAHGVPSLETMMWRVIALVIVFSVIVLLRRISLKVPDGAGAGLSVMIVSTAMISVGYLGSVQFIPVALAVIVFFTFPILILLLSPIMEGRSLSLKRLLIGMVAFSGLAIAVGPDLGKLNPLGLGLAVMASFGATLQFFSGRSLAGKMQPLAFGLIAHLVLLPVAVAVSIWMGSGQIVSLATPDSISQMGWIAICVVAGTYSLAYFCHMSAVRHAPPSIIAPFFNLEPITSIGVAIVLLREVPTNNQLVGGALVLAALLGAGLTGTRQQIKN
ncbi:MAG: DMT family transporter [Anderseniella sp.]